MDLKTTMGAFFGFFLLSLHVQAFHIPGQDGTSVDVTITPSSAADAIVDTGTELYVFANSDPSDAKDKSDTASYTFTLTGNGTNDWRPDPAPKPITKTFKAHTTAPVTIGTITFRSNSKNAQKESPFEITAKVNVLTITTVFENAVGAYDASHPPIVRLKNDQYPQKRFIIHGQMEVENAANLGTDLAVTLVNPDGRLGFSESGDATTMLTLNHNGDPTTFQVSGEKMSAAMGDAIIEIRKDSAGGSKLAIQPMTVFYFGAEQGHPETYRISVEARFGYEYTPTPTYGYYFPTKNIHADPNNPNKNTASAAMLATTAVLPPGVNLNNSKYSELKLGVCQVVMGGTVETANYALDLDNPITWLDPKKPSVLIYKLAVQTKTVMADKADSSARSTPVYSQANGSLVQPNVELPFIEATDLDGPGDQFPTKMTIPVSSVPKGPVVANANYILKSIDLADKFKDWSVTYDSADTNPIIALRETTWSVTVNSDSGDQTITPSQGDYLPKEAPLTGAPFATDSAITSPLTGVGGTIPKP